MKAPENRENQQMDESATQRPGIFGINRQPALVTRDVLGLASTATPHRHDQGNGL